MINDLFMPKLSLITTFTCNIRCKLCSNYIPYYKKPYHPSIDELCRYTDRAFEIVDKVGDFIFGGGEPFLRNDLYMIIDYVRKYLNRINRIDISTNGTIIPCDNIISSLKKVINIMGGGGVNFAS